ncbi:hypothetical protein [Absidia glauca]|uniref:Uncharacterized protein n=1 Tax=Absidia glauca TaxID=4829 RepID=A0A168NLW9_ABSGL|nr:hypothetical protein [Absidia glauca]
MHNPLKRHSSVDDLNDRSHSNKRTKHMLNAALSPHLPPYTDQFVLPGSHLPPSPPVVVDTPLPSPLSAASIDSIPTLKRFTITTRQLAYDQTLYTPSAANYANINQILYEAHVERTKDSLSSGSYAMDTSMEVDYDDANHYDYANAVLRQAFLQRHPSPP